MADKYEDTLQQVAEELSQLSDQKFFKIINLLNLCTAKARELRQERDDLRARVAQRTGQMEYIASRENPNTSKEMARYFLAITPVESIEPINNIIKAAENLLVNFETDDSCSFWARKLQEALDDYRGGGSSGKETIRTI